MSTLVLNVWHEPKFVDCLFITADESEYRMHGLFMCHVKLEYLNIVDTIFNSNMHLIRARQKMFDEAEAQFGPSIDADQMVRWYWSKYEEVLYLRHDRDALILKLALDI